MSLAQILVLKTSWVICSVVAFVAGADQDDVNREVGNLFAIVEIGGLYGEEQEVSVCAG